MAGGEQRHQLGDIQGTSPAQADDAIDLVCQCPVDGGIDDMNGRVGLDIEINADRNPRCRESLEGRGEQAGFFDALVRHQHD